MSPNHTLESEKSPARARIIRRAMPTAGLIALVMRESVSRGTASQSAFALGKTSFTVIRELPKKVRPRATQACTDIWSYAADTSPATMPLLTR